MPKRISLPSDSQVMANQAFAVIAATQTALVMTAAALRCEHINIDEFHLYLADENGPDKSLRLAHDIVDAVERLIPLLSDYRATVNAEIQRLKSVADLPF
jgi:hypothetical protein